jgi:hypothetical protein
MGMLRTRMEQDLVLPGRSVPVTIFPPEPACSALPASGRPYAEIWVRNLERALKQPKTPATVSRIFYDVGARTYA